MEAFTLSETGENGASEELCGNPLCKCSIRADRHREDGAEEVLLRQVQAGRVGAQAGGGAAGQPL